MSGYSGGVWGTSVGIILVLFILLVIILAAWV
ncbi:YjcZ family sporulation protein [Paenibacillus sp. DMB20]|nr:YjcZ family sporulation protein [Paenibacillus sp. DMB20]